MTGDITIKIHPWHRTAVAVLQDDGSADPVVIKEYETFGPPEERDFRALLAQLVRRELKEAQS